MGDIDFVIGGKNKFIMPVKNLKEHSKSFILVFNLFTFKST